jgi:hypothetical protein
MGVSRATYYQWKVNASSGMCADQHGNVGTTKPQIHTLQAIATLRQMLEQSTDHMPHKTTALEIGEKIVSKSLSSSWCWKDSLLELNIVNAQLGLKKVSASGLSRIQNESFTEYSPKSRGDNFARCGQCDRLKKLRAAYMRGSRTAVFWTKQLEAYGQAQRAHRESFITQTGICQRANPVKS